MKYVVNADFIVEADNTGDAIATIQAYITDWNGTAVVNHADEA